ncbi:MAG TPA: hypothetical protein IAD36_05400 [Candidatus Scatomorpha intestinigallinarum]|uniref:Uncharacterized protein n=1 Tax=Candidatus Scatomorpha intestinigallinarum TaxID=2840923 RepID=A0A9D1DLC1_9FIRM|nr:hypothetical protein [Candidatus Scatomorpha intestinigallinarum]
MEGKYPLLIDGRESGELRVTRRGALTLFEAEAEDGGGILRLSVYGGGREGYLGVMSPSGEGRVALRRQLSRAALRDFPEQIEYAAPAGAAPAVTEPEPGPEPESAPEPEPGQDEGPEGGLIWYSSPGGTLSAHDGRRLLVALPADDARVPAWAGDVVRSINGRKYVVFPW